MLVVSIGIMQEEKKSNLLHSVRDESTMKYGNNKDEVYVLCRTLEMPEVETKRRVWIGKTIVLPC